MNSFQSLLADLVAQGYTQTAIADECGCAKSTINDLVSGVTKMPGYDLGAKLTELHKRAMQSARRAEKRKVSPART